MGPADLETTADGGPDPVPEAALAPTPAESDKQRQSIRHSLLRLLDCLDFLDRIKERLPLPIYLAARSVIVLGVYVCVACGGIIVVWPWVSGAIESIKLFLADQNKGAFIVLAAILLLFYLPARWGPALRGWSRKLDAHYQYQKRVQTSETTQVSLGETDKRRLRLDDIIRKSAESPETNNNNQVPEPRIVAVVSGKGGVGKSTVALGLWELISRERPALLVDFDLQNRGLTSLLRDSCEIAQPDFVFSMLKEFVRRKDLQAIIDQYDNVNLEATGQLSRDVSGLNISYSGTGLGEMPRPIMHVSGTMIPRSRRRPPSGNDLNPANARFLPSISPADSFLSERLVRDASENAAFLFFQALLYRAIHTAPHTPTIVLDCHGAHDLYTVGLIRAATDLIIVTTPDASSLEGTRELIRFSQGVQQFGETHFPRSILVANRCLRNDPNANELAKAWSGNLSAGVIRIEDNDIIESVSRSYEFGNVSADQSFYKHLLEVCHRLNLVALH